MEYIRLEHNRAERHADVRRVPGLLWDLVVMAVEAGTRGEALRPGASFTSSVSTSLKCRACRSPPSRARPLCNPHYNCITASPVVGGRWALAYIRTIAVVKR